ncbi:hypothetical protein DSUL_150087 [Desulfovibrionales bacterium]
MSWDCFTSGLSGLFQIMTDSEIVIYHDVLSNRRHRDI